MRILALDIGQKRIGLAQSDELKLLAESHGFIERRTDKQAIEEIRSFVSTLQANTIVVGLPKHMNGDEGEQAKKARSFAESLALESSIQIVFWDERLTTRQVERELIARDMSRSKRKLKRDAAAAEILLQNYLDFLNHHGEKQ